MRTMNLALVSMSWSNTTLSVLLALSRLPTS